MKIDGASTFSGTVVAGDRRGRVLGFPTANLRLPDPARAPRHGVYAARVGDCRAAVSVGVRPTFGAGLEPLMEVHLLDFDGDLYGQTITVELLHFLRPELRFGSVGELVAQMEADLAAVRQLVVA